MPSGRGLWGDRSEVPARQAPFLSIGERGRGVRIVGWRSRMRGRWRVSTTCANKAAYHSGAAACTSSEWAAPRASTSPHHPVAPPRGLSGADRYFDTYIVQPPVRATNGIVAAPSAPAVKPTRLPCATSSSTPPHSPADQAPRAGPEGTAALSLDAQDSSSSTTLYMLRIQCKNRHTATDSVELMPTGRCKRRHREPSTACRHHRCQSRGRGTAQADAGSRSRALASSVALHVEDRRAPHRAPGRRWPLGLTPGSDSHPQGGAGQEETIHSESPTLREKMSTCPRETMA